MIDKLYNKFTGLKLGLCICATFVYFLGVTFAGGNVIQYLLFEFCCITCILIPGAAIADKTGKSSMYSLYFVYGLALITVLYTGFKLVGTDNFLWLFILYVIFDAYYIYKKKIHIDVPPRNQFIFLSLIFFFAIFIYTFLSVAKHAHPQQVGQLLISQDFMWTVGNRESLKLAFPATDIRFSDVTLKYHFFTELLTAAISSFTGISCYDILGFYMQSFMMAFFLTALYDLGTVYYKSEAKTNLFITSFFTLSCLSLWKVLPNGTSVFNYSLLETILSNVNSQCTSLAFTAVFVTLVLKTTGIKLDVSNIITAVLTFGFIIFSKSPVAAILAIAILCAAIVNFFTKNEKKTVTILSVTVFVLFICVYSAFLSAGTGNSTSFSFTQTLTLGYFKNFLRLFSLTNQTLYKLSIPVFMAISLFCMAPFQCITLVPQVIKDTFRLFQLPFEKLWFYACICGGALAFFITSHEAFSQVYFIYVAIFFMNLLTIEHFDFSVFKIKYIVHYGFVVLSCITTLFFYINFGGSGIRQYLFHYNILEKPDYVYCIKSEDELAGDFLRKNMRDSELFITNRTHTGAGEGLSNVYTCFSGRQSYMEGFKYTVSNMGIDFKADVAPRIELVGKVFGIYEYQIVDANEILTLCKNKNIRYAVFSTQFEGDTSGLEDFSKVFQDNTVTIYKLY